ncbi:MAG: hypothetical protein ACKPKO_41320, partial [Candidatus Fonsibacter sp.]
MILLNVPYWKIAEEPLTMWLARLEVPEEFHAGVDSNNVVIVDFIFCERRIDGATAADMFKAHHVRGYLL